ncbi:hypothetical protein FAY22_12475 [Noviherbaspirillum sp. UKPF54]|nr:hypothetical protein FAY22_12475 [Noviherbaspirillum sp. UKPF54]
MSKGTGKGGSTGTKTSGGSKDSGQQLTGYPGGNWPSKTGSRSGTGRGNAPPKPGAGPKKQ